MSKNTFANAAFATLFAGPISALHECWIIGDLFVSQVFHALPYRNTQNRLAKKGPLYVYDNFTVKCFSTNPLSKIKEAHAHLVNSLIHGLNKNKYLPRLIIILPDWDIVKYVGEVSFGIFLILEKMLSWTVEAMYRAIETRKEDLRKFKSGVVTYGEPKILWVKMIDRVGVIDRALAVCNKFNRALENVLSRRRNNYVIDVNNKINDASFFSQQLKELNDDGLHRFWLEIDKKIEEFEYNKDPFIPKKAERLHHMKHSHHKHSHQHRN